MLSKSRNASESVRTEFLLTSRIFDPETKEIFDELICEVRIWRFVLKAYVISSKDFFSSSRGFLDLKTFLSLPIGDVPEHDIICSSIYKSEWNQALTLC